MLHLALATAIVLYSSRSSYLIPTGLLSPPMEPTFMLDSFPKVTNSLRGSPVRPLISSLDRLILLLYMLSRFVNDLTHPRVFLSLRSTDFRLQVYDMTSPPAKYIKPRRNPRRTGRTSLFDDQDRDHESTLKVLKTIRGHPGRWTITDSHLSPDNERQDFNCRTNVVILNNAIKDDLFIHCE